MIRLDAEALMDRFYGKAVELIILGIGSLLIIAIVEGRR